MEIGLNQGLHRRDHALPTWLLAALFWAFTYALFAYRAHLRYGDDYLLISPQRFGATLVGAGLYWLVMANLIRVSGKKPAAPVAVIATILPASIVVLAARLLLEQFVDGQITQLQMNTRWVLVWSGYFGLWVSAALALHSSGLAKTADTAAHARPVPALPVREQPELEITESSIDWVVDELASAMADMPAVQRDALLERLEHKAGYEIADPIERSAVQHNARIRLVRDLALRSRQRP